MLFIDRRSSAAAARKRSNSGTGSRSVMLRASVVAAGIIAGAVGGIVGDGQSITQ
jgi:hypothetical protein